MLALTFADPADYDKVQPDDKLDILGLESFAPGKNLTLVCKHKDGKKDEIELAHILQRGPDRVVQGWICVEPGQLIFVFAFAIIAANLLSYRWRSRPRAPLKTKKGGC